MKWRGFTLIELLVVLSVTGILLTIAIPGYAQFMNFNRLVTLTNDLVASLHLARSEAIKRSKRVTACKSSTAMGGVPTCNANASWQQGWIVFVDDGTKGVLDIGDQVLKVHGEASGGAMITANNFSSYVSYLPSGVSRGASGLGNGTFNVCLAGNKRSIIINKTGRIRTEKSTC